MTIWRRLPELDGEALAARYVAQGQPLRRIAAETGLSYGTVWRRLSEHGVTFRPRGGYHRDGSAATSAMSALRSSASA